MLAFVEAYERADWTSCDRLGLDLLLTRTSIPEQYLDAVSWTTDALGRTPTARRGLEAVRPSGT